MKNVPDKDSLLQQWKAKRKNEENVNAFSKAPRNAPIPLSFGQQRLWFLQQLYPDNPFYNYSESFRFKGLLNEDLLQKSLAPIVDQHRQLRSYYRVEEDSPVIKFDAGLQLQLEKFDFTSYSKTEQKVKVNEFMVSQSQTRFDLSSPPLWKFSLLKIDAAEYLLFITMHHILTDEWSFDLLKKQLAANYRALSQGKSIEGESLEIQFSDFAYWERFKPSFERKISYWRDLLSGDIPALNLPTDHSRPLRPSFTGAMHTRNFPPELSKNALELAKKLEVTPFVLFLSIYTILLWKYSGQHDILVGTPISGRDRMGLDKIFGFFINTIPLRNKLNLAETFSEHVRQLKLSTLEAFSNSEVPFDVLVKEIRPQRSLTANPFFDVTFTYTSRPPSPSFGPDLELIAQSEFDTGVSKFDLSLAIIENEGQLSASFEYATDLFEESTIEQLQDHLQLLLRNIVTNPDKPISKIQMLTRQEAELFLDKSSKENGQFDTFNAIHELIEEQVIQNPDAKALVFGEDSLSYSELNTKATFLAKSILEHTRGENKIVGLCSERSLDMVVGLLAILKAGCAYLPIDPEYPLERTLYMLKDSEVPVVLTQKTQLFLFDNFDGDVLTFDAELGRGLADTIKLPMVGKDDLAYVIYTSGSSGKPKGVPITHANIVNSTTGRFSFYQENPKTFLLMSSFAFDSSKAGIFWTLCTGGTLVISKKRLEQDIDEIAAVIATHKVSHTLLLPSLYKTILEYGDLAQLGSLRTVIVAGEACTPSVCKMHFERLPKTNLYNEYGPTEATVWCIAHHIDKDKDLDKVPIGSPVANAEVYLLNQYMGLVPLGAVGEIYLGGPGLAGRYLGKPELTAMAYVDHPFDENPGKKLYRTGDLGRYRKDGAIEFLGRADQQVKIRGFRIELDEIENVLNESQMVEEAVVLVEESMAMQQPHLESSDTKATILRYVQAHMNEAQVNEMIEAITSLREKEKSYLLRQLK